VTAYSFKKQFIEPILTGRKRQTIRAVGLRHHARIDTTIQLYTGMRTKQCQLIGTAFCADAPLITLDFPRNRIHIQGRVLRNDQVALDTFAKRDGFENWAGLRAFWELEHRALKVWEGVMIEWRDFAPAPGMALP
jgi:hypothetical protein